MAINILAVALSVAGVLNPTTGALVHNAGSCFVVLVAAMLYDKKFWTKQKRQIPYEICLFSGALAESRTPDNLIKSQVLYLLSYKGKCYAVNP